eukprot:gene10836-3456_t
MKLKLSKLSLGITQSNNRLLNILSPLTPKKSKEIDFCLDLNAFQEEENQIREYCRECIRLIEENNLEKAYLLLNNKEISQNSIASLLTQLRIFVDTDHYTIEFQDGKMTAKAEIWDCLHRDEGESGIFIGRGDMYSIDKTKFNVLPCSFRE